MNPTPVTLTLNLHNPLHDLESAAGANPPRLGMTSQARLERVHADRALILEGLKGTPAPPYAAMPPVSPGTTVVVNAMALPAQGYAARGEPLAATGPVEPGSDVEEVAANAHEGGPDRAQALVAASSVTKRELAFLDDKSLSIEEKLFQFMCLMTKKADQDLVSFMKEISGKRSSSSTGSGASTGGSSGSSGGGTGSSSGTGTGSTTGTSGSSGSGGATGADSGYGSDLGDQIGAEVEALTERYTGPALGAVATALGFPELAPVAGAVGNFLGHAAGAPIGHAVNEVVDAAGDAFGAVGGAFGSIGGGLFGSGGDLDLGAMAKMALPARHEQVGGGLRVASSIVDGAEDGADADPAGGESPAVAKATSSGSSSPATTDTVDEKLQALQLQRLVEKQNTMFQALSNVLKSLHDARMTAVQNLR